jgi:putative hydrolase of the HAD superfamily
VYAAFARSTGLTVEEIARVLTRAAMRAGAPPLDLLETARITEEEFLRLVQEAADAELPGRGVDLSQFRRRWFAGMTPNEDFALFLATLRDHGHRLVLLTNNVREWRESWLPTLPAGLFELIVDSSEEGVRKPDGEIFRRTVDRLGLTPAQCLFVDDVWEHCAAAHRLGMRVVWFRSNPQASYEIAQALGVGSAAVRRAA